MRFSILTTFMVKMLVHLWFIIYYIYGSGFHYIYGGYYIYGWLLLHIWLVLLLWLIITFTGDTASQLGAGD